MVTWILHQAGLDPSYIIGGVSKNLGGNAHAGKGEWFVIEADEYDTMFLGLDPAIAAITTLEHDHPDCFPTAEEYRAAFCAFAARTVPGGGLVLSQDHLEVANLAVCAGPGVRALTCGLDPTADILGSGVNRNSEGGFSCEIFDQGIYRTTLNLCVPGHHNIANAVTAYAVCSLVGIPADQISQALASFIGTGRRFDIYGIIDGITLIDDYAHHPTAIRETLAAARNRYPASRLIAVWQPHTYSRTRALMDDYCQAFADADMVILTDIYAAREPAADFTAASVAEKINTPSVYIPSLELITERLSGMLQQGDVVLVLSAGDAIRLNPLLADELRKKEACR